MFWCVKHLQLRKQLFGRLPPQVRILLEAAHDGVPERRGDIGGNRGEWGGACVTWAARIDCGVVPVKGGRPPSISYATTPTA